MNPTTRELLVADVGRPGPHSGAPRLLQPPVGLLARIRWIFLLFATLLVTLTVPWVASATGRPVELQIMIIVLLATLLAWWVRGYRRSTFPVAGLLLEAVALGLCVAGPEQPVTTAGVVYGAVAFRTSYGPWQRALSYSAVALGAYSAGLLLAIGLGTSVDPGQVLSPLPGVPAFAVIVHLVVVASERAATRERIVSSSALAIAVAESPARVQEQALNAVAALVRGVPGAVASIVLPTSPGLPAPRGARVSMPLTNADGWIGDLVVDTDDPLPAEVNDALEAVSAQLALGLSAAELTADLRHRATHDPLTDLANRRAFDQAVDQALRGPSPETVLLLLDLDGFKQVNDGLGHVVGDLLLVTVADRLRAVVRSTDLVARLGGDEFVVVLQGPGATEQAPALVQRIDAEIARPMSIDGHDVTVGVSIGCAAARSGVTADDLLHEADTQMYRSKQRHRTLAAGDPHQPLAALQPTSR